MAQATNVIPFPNAASTGNVDYIKLLRAIERLARCADHSVSEIKENIYRELRRESIRVIREAGIPFPDITEGL